MTDSLPDPEAGRAARNPDEVSAPESPMQPDESKSRLALTIVASLLIGCVVLGLVMYGIYAYGVMLWRTQASVKRRAATTRINPTQIPATATVQPSAASEPSQNAVQTFRGSTMSFQYPQSWPEPVERQLSTRVEIESADKLVITDGSYYNQQLGRERTFAEYVSQMLPAGVKTEPAAVGALEGVRYVEKDAERGEAVTMVLKVKTDTTRIITVTYYSSTADLQQANAQLDAIVESIQLMK